MNEIQFSDTITEINSVYQWKTERCQTFEF